MPACITSKSNEKVCTLAPARVQLRNKQTEVGPRLHIAFVASVFRGIVNARGGKLVVIVENIGRVEVRGLDPIDHIRQLKLKRRQHNEIAES